MFAADGSDIQYSSYMTRGSTNNEAEYQGLIEGLKLAAENGVKHITVKGDSKLVIMQMKGTYKVKAKNLQPIHKEAVRAKSVFETCTFQHVYRDQNRAADTNANKAMDERKSKVVFSANFHTKTSLK